VDQSARLTRRIVMLEVNAADADVQGFGAI
jgi:hypothetical protein